jgi:hypothetical protein
MSKEINGVIKPIYEYLLYEIPVLLRPNQLPVISMRLLAVPYLYCALCTVL